MATPSTCSPASTAPRMRSRRTSGRRWSCAATTRAPAGHPWNRACWPKPTTWPGRSSPTSTTSRYGPGPACRRAAAPMASREPARRPLLLARPGRDPEAIIASDDLLVSLDAIRSRAEGVNWGDYNGEYGRITSYVQQFDDQHAAIWVSQSFLYGEPDGKYLTTRCSSPARPAWYVTAASGRWSRWAGVRPAPGRGGGQRRRARDRGDRARGDEATQVAELDRQTLTWQPRGSLPSPFWPLPSSTGLRGFSIGKGCCWPIPTAATASPVALPRPMASRRPFPPTRCSIHGTGAGLEPPRHRRLPGRAGTGPAHRPGVLGGRRLVRRQPGQAHPQLPPGLTRTANPAGTALHEGVHG